MKRVNVSASEVGTVVRCPRMYQLNKLGITTRQAAAAQHHGNNFHTRESIKAREEQVSIFVRFWRWLCRLFR
ncbi:hypothetical protein C9I99_21060 [Photobacterium lutimaris]|uniref:PD-(D/E)XK endonuclease-like domain-containing protein n=1 Tax=Photobacterium lutimaris TaxID=388278 RepID=A0A2T3ITJ0_9GAMM|nr:hypothetical protein C9I99_21060 [Photobacterium lutimaris]